jgi:hypothetical protein
MSSDLLPPISLKSPQNGSLFGRLRRPKWPPPFPPLIVYFYHREYHQVRAGAGGPFFRNWAGALFSPTGVRKPSGHSLEKVLLYAQPWSMRMSIN